MREREREGGEGEGEGEREKRSTDIPIRDLCSELNILKVEDFGELMAKDISSKSFSLPIFISPVEPPNKGHCGANNFVPCREVVPISEVK